LRSIVVMMIVRLASVDLIGYCQVLLPSPRIDRVNGVSGDISMPQRLDVEIKILVSAQAVGQGAQPFCEVPRRILRLRHADRLEAKSGSGRYLRETSEVGRNHGGNLGVSAGGGAVRHQHDRRAVA